MVPSGGFINSSASPSEGVPVVFGGVLSTVPMADYYAPAK